MTNHRQHIQDRSCPDSGMRLECEMAKTCRQACNMPSPSVLKILNPPVSRECLRQLQTRASFRIQLQPLDDLSNDPSRHNGSKPSQQAVVYSPQPRTSHGCDETKFMVRKKAIESYILDDTAFLEASTGVHIIL